MKRAFRSSAPRSLGALSALVAIVAFGGVASSQPAPKTPAGTGGYTVTNEKGPGLPIVIAVQPWPQTLLGAAPGAQPTGTAPTQVPGVPQLAPGQEGALQQLQYEAEQYRKSATGYAKAVGQIMRQRYEQKRKTRLSAMQENIDKDTAELRRARLETIERLKAFLAKYPDVPEHTPNAMFRLAALYEEQAIESDVDPADAQYTQKLRASYAPAETLYREVIAKFPSYSQRAAVQFFLGALLADTGRAPESQFVWRALVCSNRYQFPLPPPQTTAEEKAREKWKDGIPPAPQDHDEAFWERWRETHYAPVDPKKRATPKKRGAAEANGEDSYRDPYPEDCVPLPAPIAAGEDEPRFLAQTWWRIGEYHYSRGDEAAEEEGYFGASPYRYNRALSAYQHAIKTTSETVKVFSMYKIAWTYFKQQRYDAARQQFLSLLEYFDDKEKKGGPAGDAQMRQDAYDYVASALTYLDMEGPGPDEPFIERDDVFGQFSGKALEAKLEVALDRVQDPKMVPQDRIWTSKIYKALAAEFESDEVQLNAVRAYELIIKKWPCDPEAPQYQNKIAQLYDLLAIKAEAQSEKDEYASKALAARTKLLDYVGKDSKWVQCNKDNPDAIRSAEALMTEGVKNAAGRHTNLGRVYLSKAQGAPDGSKESLENLGKAREEYRLALKGWQAYLAQDPEATDSYESRYWIADSLHKIVVITHAMAEPLDPKVVKEARDAAVEVRDSNLDDKYLRYAAYFAVDVYDKLADEGFERYRKANCAPGSGYEIVEDPTWELGDACVADSVRDRREQKRIWIRPVPDAVVSTMREREDYAAKVPKALDADGNGPRFRFQVADGLYRYGRWEEATPRFEAIWRENCGKNEQGFEAWYRLVVMSNLREDTQRSMFLVNEVKGAKSCAMTEDQKLKERMFSEATSINALFKEADDAFAAAEKETDPKLRAQKYREAAAKYEAALKVAPSRPESPRAAINSAYCYKQVNEYKRAAEVYRFFLDKYGKEEDLIAYRDGDAKRGIKKDPEQFRTRLDYTKKALGELGRTYLQAFDYQSAAKHYDDVAARTLLDAGERRDAAFTAVVLQANLGNRDRMLAARQRFLAFNPPASERAEIDFVVAEFEYKQWRQDPKNAQQRGRAIQALDGYYTQYRTQGPAARYVVAVAYDMSQLRKDSGEGLFRDWYKKTIDAFASYSAANKDAKSTRESDMAAEAAYFFTNEKIERDWDPTPAGPRIKYEGTADVVVKKLEADNKKRIALIEELDGLVKTYLSPKWTPVVYAREGSVNDVMRSALARAKVEVLDPKAKKTIDDIEKKAQRTLEDPNASEEAKAKAEELLARADAIRQNTDQAWRDKRKQYYDVIEPEMIDRYTRGYLRGKQFNVRDPMITRAVQRLAYYTDQLDDTKMRLYLAQVEKDFPGFKYRDQMFKQARPGAVSSPAPTVDRPIGPPVSAGTGSKTEGS
jgi:outer membrane protein assembly factor BamD (BamD/ComL family)